jgi:hypothetical protein
MYFNFRSKRPKVKNKNLDDFEIPLKGTRVADNQSAGMNTLLTDRLGGKEAWRPTQPNFS